MPVTMHQCWVRYVQQACPFRSNVPFAIELDPHIGPHVSHLHKPRFPTAIVWRVGAVIISAFQRISRWSRSHVVNEGPYIIAPSFAHCYTAASIIIESLVRWIVTPPAGGVPYKVFSARALSMFQATLNNCIAAQTTATFVATIAEMYR